MAQDVQPKETPTALTVGKLTDALIMDGARTSYTVVLRDAVQQNLTTSVVLHVFVNHKTGNVELFTRTADMLAADEADVLVTNEKREQTAREEAAAEARDLVQPLNLAE